MKIGIMQPYFLPYIGYFQLINAVDKYVVYDDVNFIKGGWINRNKILLNDREFMINLPMQGASSFKKINEISIGNNRERILSTIDQAYRKANYFNDTFSLIKDIIHHDSENLANFISNSIIKISEFLQIKTNIILSSEIKKDDNLKAQDKVISICKILGAKEYYNAIGGKELYNKADFNSQNIKLNFIKTKPIQYNQFKNDFVPWLSIIDIMMFNSKDEIKVMLNQYEIL